MAENKTLTPEEREAAIRDALQWSTTILHNALTYVGSKKMQVTGNITGPDGKKYILSFKLDEDGTTTPPTQAADKEADVPANAKDTASKG